MDMIAAPFGGGKRAAVSLSYPVTSDHQLARLLQIGMVPEEIVEARAHKHHETLGEEELGDEIVSLLSEAAEESAEHRRRLEKLVGELDVAGGALAGVREHRLKKRRGFGRRRLSRQVADVLAEFDGTPHPASLVADGAQFPGEHQSGSASARA